MDLDIDRKSSLIGDNFDDYSLARQYQNAYKVLLSSTLAIDTIAMPILYLIRHYLELLLKINIEYFSNYSNSNCYLTKSTDTHELKKLNEAFFHHYNRAVENIVLNISDEEIDNVKNALSNIIDRLDDIDKSSQSFRYVYDKKKKRQFEKSQYIDFHELIALLEEGEKILLYSIDIFEAAILK